MLLFGRTPQVLHPAYGGTEFITCRGLTDETDTIVEFDYDGVIPSSGRTSLSNPALHQIHVEAVDMAGNVSEASFVFAETSLQHIATLEGHTASVHSVAFSPDGITLASGGGDGTVKLWNASTRDHIATLEEHTARVNSLSFSPDGTTLASGSYDGTVKLWNVLTKENIATLSGHNAVTSVAFSPDGATLASVDYIYVLKLWDVATRTNIATLENASARSVAFSSDGMTLASPGDYYNLNAIKLFDVGTRTHIATLERQFTNNAWIGHKDWVFAVAFAPDGTMLASGSQDKTVQLWNVATREHIAIFSGHTAWVASVAFSPDGTTLASASGDNKIKLWDTSEWAGPGQALTDFNGDGRTDFVDFFLFADAYGGTDPRFDLDGNGTVDFADFFRFVDAFGA